MSGVTSGRATRVLPSVDGSAMYLEIRRPARLRGLRERLVEGFKEEVCVFGLVNPESGRLVPDGAIVRRLVGMR